MKLAESLSPLFGIVKVPGSRCLPNLNYMQADDIAKPPWPNTLRFTITPWFFPILVHRKIELAGPITHRGLSLVEAEVHIRGQHLYKMSSLSLAANPTSVRFGCLWTTHGWQRKQLDVIFWRPWNLTCIHARASGHPRSTNC